MRELCANLGLHHKQVSSRREPKIFSRVRAANHFQKSVCGANQKYFHKFVPQTIFKNQIEARTKNIFIGSRRESFSKIYLWRKPIFFSQVRAANHFQRSICGANQNFFHRFAPRTIFKTLLVARTKIFFTGSRREPFSKIY